MVRFDSTKNKIKHNGFVKLHIRGTYDFILGKATYDYTTEKDTVINVVDGKEVDLRLIDGRETILLQDNYKGNDEQLVRISLECPRCKTYMDHCKTVRVSGNPSQDWHHCPKCGESADVSISVKFKRNEEF